MNEQCTTNYGNFPPECTPISSLTSYTGRSEKCTFSCSRHCCEVRGFERFSNIVITDNFTVVYDYFRLCSEKQKDCPELLVVLCEAVGQTY